MNERRRVPDAAQRAAQLAARRAKREAAREAAQREAIEAARLAEEWSAPIRRAVALLAGEEQRGAQKRMADATGASRALVSQWVRGRRRVSGPFVLSVEQAVGGKVTRHELRPDIFGPAPAPAPEAETEAAVA